MQEHLLWYIQQVASWAEDLSMTFIVPDIPSSYAQDKLDELKLAWEKVPASAQVLIVPGTALCDNVIQNIVGHALKRRMSGPVHPGWTHSFSQYFKPLSGETKLWTYDSVSHARCPGLS